MSQLLLVKRLQQSLSAEQPDADLLAAYVAQRDHDAFAALVMRHGPLVWSICRRHLRESSAADDATQTTFLTLVRQARRVRPETLAAWLVCVARRVCRKGRLADARRRQREAAAPPPASAATPGSEMRLRELLALMDEELHNLPLRHRSALLACYWQGLTQADAARQLGTTANAIKGLLERGRAKLLERLRRRGLTADVALPGLLAAPLALAALPDDLFAQTVALAKGPTARASLWLPASSLPRWGLGGITAMALGVGWFLLPGTEPPKPQPNQPMAEGPPTARPSADLADDPLPDNALLRLGSLRFQHPNQAYELALSPDGKIVVTMGTGASPDTRTGLIIAWDAATGKRLWAEKATEMLGSDAGEKLLAFTPDGKTLITVDERNMFAIWDVATGAHRVVPVKHDLPSTKTLPAKHANIPKAVRYQTEYATSVDVAADGRSLAVGTSNGLFLTDFDGNVRAQILNPGDPNRVLNSNDRILHHGDYTFARFSPDGKSLAVVTSDLPKTLRLCDPVTAKERLRIDLTAYLVRLAFSPDGKRVAATERDNSVRVYDVESGKRLYSWTVELNDPVENFTSAVAFSSDGKFVAAGATDNSIYLWDATTGNAAGRLEGSGWYPWSLAFTTDGKILYSTGWEGIVRRWDVAARKQVPMPPGLARGSEVVAASPDGKKLAFKDDTGALRVIDAKKGSEIRRLESDDDKADVIVFSHDGRLLAAGGKHPHHVHVILWDLAAAKVLRRWDWPNVGDPHASVEDIVFSPDDKQLAIAVFRLGLVRVLDISGDGQRLLKHFDVYGLDFAPDGATLATAGWDQIIRLWNPRSGDLLREAQVDAPRQDARIYGIRYSPDRRSLATANMNAQVYLWDAKNLRQNISFTIAGNFGSNALAYSPDGLRLATGDSAGRIRVWDSQTGAKLWDGASLEGRTVTVGFGRDSRAVIAGGNGVGYLWDTRPRDLPKKELAELWTDLNGTDAVAADRAFWALADRPDETVALFAKNVHPKREEAVDVERMAKLVTQLNDAKFAEREAAEAALAKLGWSARPLLKKALSTTESAEARQRLSKLLNRLVDDESTRRRYQRLVGVLAQVNTPEARKLLHDWADTAADSLAEFAAAAAKRAER